MNFIKKIFIGSFVALFVAAPAFADIVSKTNIVAGSNVAVTTPTSGTNAGKVVISATDTTYTTGTPTYSGTTMLYDTVGTNTDGTYQQKVAETNLNKVTDKTGFSADINSTDKYPSMAVANEMAKQAASLVGADISDLESKVDDMDTAYKAADTTLQGNIDKKQNLLNSGTGGNVTVSGSGNMVTSVTANAGTVTVSKANVQVPVGSATATTYASIWIE